MAGHPAANCTILPAAFQRQLARPVGRSGVREARAACLGFMASTEHPPRHFDKACQLAALDDLRFRGHIDASWLQGRSAFGGLSAAMALSANRAALRGAFDAPDLLALRQVDIDFLAPICPGPVEIEAWITRKGPAVTWSGARIISAGAMALELRAVDASPRHSRADMRPHDMALPRGPVGLAETPHATQDAPAFLRYFDIRWSEGAPPFAGATTAAFAGWVRHRGPAHGLLALLALTDAWPAPTLQLLQAHAPASTARWTIRVVGEPSRLAATDGERWHTYAARTVAAQDGAVHFRGELADEHGHILLVSEQLAFVFDR